MYDDLNKYNKLKINNRTIDKYSVLEVSKKKCSPRAYLCVTNQLERKV